MRALVPRFHVDAELTSQNFLLMRKEERIPILDLTELVGPREWRKRLGALLAIASAANGLSPRSTTHGRLKFRTSVARAHCRLAERLRVTAVRMDSPLRLIVECQVENAKRKIHVFQGVVVPQLDN